MKKKIKYKNNLNFLKRASLISFFLLLLLQPVHAQPINALASIEGNNGESSDLSGFESKALQSTDISLDKALEIALENSLDIQIAKFDALISKTSLARAESLFDTFLTAKASYLHDRNEQPTSLLGSDSKETEYSLGLEKRFNTATTLSLESSLGKQRSNSTFSTLNPYSQAQVTLSLKQELGKNFFGISDKADIKITKLDIENADFTSLDDIELVIFEVGKAYWELALRNQELTIAREMIAQADKLRQIYSDKKNLGLTEDSEFMAIEALVFERKVSLEKAILSKEAAENELLLLINKGDFNQDLNPIDALDVYMSEVDLSRELTEAISSRRDYKRLSNDLEKNKIDIIVRRNDMWPQIDLEASFSRNNIDREPKRVFSDIYNENSDEIAVAFSVKLPFEMREEKANLKKANFEKKQLLLKLKLIERLILKDINDKVTELKIFNNQVKLNKQISGLHEKKLKYQTKRLSFGRSDSDTLIRYQEELFLAKLDLAKALYDYRIALMGLDLSKNTLLDKYWHDPL